MLLSDRYYEIGINIANELNELLPEDSTTQNLIDFMQNEDNGPYVMQAILLGHQGSDSIVRANELVSTLSRAQVEYREQLPLVSALIQSLLQYTLQTALKTTSVALFAGVIAKPEAFNEYMVPDITGIEDRFLLSRQLAFGLTLVSGAVMSEGKGQQVFDEAETLLNMVIERFSLMTDAELRKQGNQQRRQLGAIQSVNEPTDIEDAFEYFKLMQDQFTSNQRTAFVESKTRLYEITRPSDD